MAAADLQHSVEVIFRIESPRLIAGLARMTRDVGLAEDLAQDALVVALEQWPTSGVPENPGAWLMATAKRRGIDMLRRRQSLERKQGEILRAMEARTAGAPEAEAARDAALDDEYGDDVLRLIFTVCHPVLSAEARVALTLRLLCGLTTEEIARAYLVPEATIAQRIVRAKRTLSRLQGAFEAPAGRERTARLASVLEVVYLVFNEGYAATAGVDWVRPALCEEALRLGGVLASRMPHEPEVHGLVALMELQASRLRARTGPAGEVIRLLDQDRSRWDRLRIQRGLAALARAMGLGAAAGADRGPYALQAAIAACHARARGTDPPDWAAIAALYAELARVLPSPVVELNRAVAVSMDSGPAAGLALIDELATDAALDGYHLLPAVRADLLFRLGRLDEARAEFERAAGLARNAPERRLLLERAAALSP